MTAARMKQAVDDLDQARVLIVEDEPFISCDLAEAVEAAGGVVIGPAATVMQALALIQETAPEAAILDVNLPDGHVGPVLDAVRHVAVVIHTGVGLPADLKQRYPEVPIYFKPTPAAVLTSRLISLLRARD